MGDIKFDLGFQDFKNDYFGAAVYFITDRAKIFDWNNNEISILLSYHKLLEKSSANYLSVGIGLVLRKDLSIMIISILKINLMGLQITVVLQANYCQQTSIQNLKLNLDYNTILL